MAQKELDIPVDGMHCSSCSLLVEKSLGKLDEVESINVDLNTNKAHMVLNDKISPDVIDKTVESVGFTVPKDEVVIQIDGMHCASCVNNVERFLPRVDGVVEANANLSNRKVTIKYYRDMLNLKEIQKTIEMLGFEYIGLDGELDVMDEEERYQKDLKGKLYRIIVGLFFAAILMAIMHFHYTIPPLTMGQLSLIIAIFPFCYVSYPILKAGWNSFKHKNLDMDVMYSMGILVAFVSSVLGTFGIVLDSSFMFYESAVMLPSFLTIGRYLEARAKRKTSSSIKELIGLQPKTATLVTTDDEGNTVEKEIDIEDINIGDILLVKPGEKIPADSIVVDGESYVDEAMITGEPVPKLKKAGIDVFSGTINQDGALKVEAQKIGSETVLSQIIQLVEKAQGSKPPVQRLANKIVSWFIPVILTIAIIVFLLWYFVGHSGLLFALTCLISVLVVACPCSLGLATPTAVTVGVGRAAEYGILIKNGETLESSKDVDVCVFDKTGTITEGKPEVADIETFDMKEEKFLQILSSVENNSNHPIAKSILNRFKSDNIKLANEGKDDLPLFAVDDFENITGKGLRANVNIDGEEKAVLAGNLKLMEAEEVDRAFAELHKSGKVLNFGVSNMNRFQMEYLAKNVKQELKADQLQLSIVHSPLIDEGLNVNMGDDPSIMRSGGTLEYLKEKDMVLQVWSPLQIGYFQGSFLGSEKYEKLNTTLKEMSEKYGVECDAIAYAWLLRLPQKVQVVTGTTSIEHLAGGAKAADILLDREDWYKLYLDAGNRLP